MKNNIYNKILGILFLIIIFSFAFLFMYQKKQTKDDIENRQLASLPEFNINKLDPFPDLYNSYFNDHFPFRSEIIKTLSKFKFYNLKISPISKKAIIGKNGWLFMAEKQLDAFQGKTNFTNKELESIKDELIYRNEYCKKKGAKFYFVIIPQKHSIYPEFIQLNYKLNNIYTPRTQLVKYLKKNNVPVLDITDYVKQHKSNKYDLFFKTDNHWNELGAFWGTKRIIEYIKKDFPQLKSLKITDYKIIQKEKKGGNIAKMFSMQNELKDKLIELDPLFVSSAIKLKKKHYKVPKGFPYPWAYENIYENYKVNNLKVLVVRESFGGNQMKFYKECFGKSIFIFDVWKHELNENIIEKEKPDIVIIQILESMLNTLITYQSHKNNVATKNLTGICK